MFAGIEFAEQNPRRKWTALVSFTAQVAAVATILVLPLFYPQSLPEALMHSRIFVPMHLGDLRVVEASHNPTVAHGAVAGPTQPFVVTRDNGVHLPGMRPLTTGPFAGPPGVNTVGQSGTGVIDSIVGDYAAVVPQPPPAVTGRPISRMMQGNLIYKVEPVYPAIAKTAGVQGAVLIRALISREGTIEQAQVISGSPWLSRAALDAIRQWRYRPYYLNGAPVEVDTEITVNFVLR
jgi:periplasmic protein TonB